MVSGYSSVNLSVILRYQRDSQSTDFREIWYLKKLQILLKSYKNVVHFTWRTTHYIVAGEIHSA